MAKDDDSEGEGGKPRKVNSHRIVISKYMSYNIRFSKRLTILCLCLLKLNSQIRNKNNEQ